MRIEIEGVGKRYRGDHWALREFSLGVDSGVLGLLGPNGAGKSTLMNILATISRPTTGRVVCNGVDVARQPDALRRVLGYLPQDFGVYPNLSAREFLAYLAAVKGVPAAAARTRIEELLDLLNLTSAANRPLGGYSGGMRQRVGIAQELLNDPRVLIVDEPTVGLDPEERLRFRHLIADLSGDRIVILSTHIVSDLEATASRIAIIERGRLLRVETPEALLADCEGRVFDWLVPVERLPELRQRHLIVAALAVMFECLPGLRGAGGNVVFFFVWTGVLGVTFSGIEGAGGTIVQRRSDVFGISAPLADFEQDLLRARPGHPAGLSIGAHIGGKPPQPLPWKGLGLDRQWLAARAAWMLVVLPLLGIAALGFDRFDPARRRRPGAQPRDSVDAATAEPTGGAWHALTPIVASPAGWRPLAMLGAELRLLLWRQPWWWYAGLLAAWLAGLANPATNGVAWVVPLAWLSCVTRWSELGARAELHGTHALLWSAPAPLLRQLPVQWLAGALLGLVAVAPVLLKLLLAGDIGVLAQVLVGAAFVPAASLAGGAIAGGPRLFELAFLMLWYAAMNGAPGARFYGDPTLAFASSYATVYLASATALLGLAAALRWLAMRR
jgi:ABC-type multidrug transport system ATPase subunit